jgi:vitamin B12 transporter
MKRILPFALLSAVPSLAPAQVARDTARTAPIVVTATRSPIAANQSPSAVTILRGEDLQRAGVVTAADALQQVPGLSLVRSASYGGATSLFIRGGESKFAKVLIDGVPVNDPGGAFDFSTLSVDNIDRIEVVRGPASVLYGSDAMAGVVQLFTRTGSGRPRVELSGRGGGYSSYDGSAAIRGSSGSLDYSASGAKHRTGGIQPFNSAFVQGVGSASLGWKGTALDARLSARLTDDEFHFPTDGSGEPVDSNAVRRDDHLSIGLDAGYRVLTGTDLRVSLASSSSHAVTDDQPDSPGDNQGYYYTTGDRSYRRNIEARLNHIISNELMATIGGNVEHQWETSATTSNFGPSDYTARRRNSGAFGQLLVSGALPYTVTVGARYDHNESFGNFLTWRTAGSVNAATNTVLRASYGTAFREPTMQESFGGGFVIGNPNLSPEQARSADIGIEQTFANVASVSATLFHNTFTNLIDYKYSATQPNYFNVARTRSTGAELEAHITLPSSLFLDGAFTYVDAKVVDPGNSTAVTALFAPGARLLRRPMHTIDLGLAFRPAYLSAEVRAHRAGSRQDVYFAPDFSSSRVTLPAYTRIDASAEVPVRFGNARSAALTLRAENLFDAKYSELAGYNYDFALNDPASVRRTGYRAPGVRILVGARVTL